MRAAYLALLLGLAGGLGLARAVLSDPPPSTVAAALGLDDDDIDARRAAAVALLTSACMHAHGFDWLPIVDPLPSVPDASLGPLDWADRWGFGVSTMVDLPVPAAVPDPNLEALDRMPSADQARVREALHGTADRPGCAQTATADVYGLRDRLLAPIRAALTALDAEIAADPAARVAIAAWSACVAPVSQGVSVERRTLAVALIERFGSRVAGTGGDPPQLHAIQAEERHVAGVVARCDAAFTAARAAVAAAHEAAFVADHRAELDELGASIRAAEAAWPTVPP